MYVGNWPRAITGQHARAGDDPVNEIGEKHKAIMRYEVQADGTLRNGKLFFDFTSATGEDGLDGIKVDQKGNLYVSAPGGLWVISQKANTWARSSPRATRTTWPGAMPMAKHFISAHAAACIASGLIFLACDPNQLRLWISTKESNYG